MFERAAGWILSTCLQLRFNLTINGSIGYCGGSIKSFCGTYFLSGPKGRVLLVVGGRRGSSALASTELFDYPGLKMGWGIWYLCFCIWDDRFSTWYVDMVYLVFGCLTLLYKFSHLKWENLKIWKVSFFSGICLEKSRVSSLTKVPNHKHLNF